VGAKRLLATRTTSNQSLMATVGVWGHRSAVTFKVDRAHYYDLLPPQQLLPSTNVRPLASYFSNSAR